MPTDLTGIFSLISRQILGWIFINTIHWHGRLYISFKITMFIRNRSHPQTDEYDFGWWWPKFPDIYLAVEENPEKTSNRKLTRLGTESGPAEWVATTLTLVVCYCSQNMVICLVCDIWRRIIIISVLPKGTSFTANSGTKAAILPKAVLLGMNRCGSFPLFSAPHSLFSNWTNLKRSERSQGHQRGGEERNVANWALRTSPKFTTGVKYQFH